MNETESVYQLITKLCKSVIKESNESVEGFDLNCAKRIAFQILLKNNFREISEKENLVQELQFSSFELSLANRVKESKQVNSFIEEIKQQASRHESICWLILHLKNIDSDPETVKHQVHYFLLIRLASCVLTYFYFFKPFRPIKISSKFRRIFRW